MKTQIWTYFSLDFQPNVKKDWKFANNELRRKKTNFCNFLILKEFLHNVLMVQLILYKHA